MGRHFSRTPRDLEFEVPDIGPKGWELWGYDSKASKEDGATTTQYYVRWVSSRMVRQGLGQAASVAQARSAHIG